MPPFTGPAVAPVPAPTVPSATGPSDAADGAAGREDHGGARGPSLAQALVVADLDAGDVGDGVVRARADRCQRLPHGSGGAVQEPVRRLGEDVGGLDDLLDLDELVGL